MAVAPDHAAAPWDQACRGQVARVAGASHQWAMRRPRLAFALAAVAAGLTAAAQAAPCRLADLRWMAGVWRADTADTQSEERWASGPGDRLMGTSWALHPGRPGGVIEAETIQADAAGAVTVALRHFTADLASAWEDKTAPMIFAAADCEADRVVFDGRGDHAGEHITYERGADAMTFTGDFLHGGKAVRVVIRFVRGP